MTASTSAPATAAPPVVGIPVGGVVEVVRGATGVVRWRAFWAGAWILNGAFVVLAWILNILAPYTFEWLDLSGPVYAFELSSDSLTVFRSLSCGCLPLPWCCLRAVECLPPSRIESVHVYEEQVSISVIIVGGGHCGGSPVALSSVEDTRRLESIGLADNLPGCDRCLLQPCLLRCSGATRDRTKRIGEFSRCFLGVTISGANGIVQLSRTAVQPHHIKELYQDRDRLRERLQIMREAADSTVVVGRCVSSSPQAAQIV